eukprot:1909955-Rhodomonas_salina.4
MAVRTVRIRLDETVLVPHVSLYTGKVLFLGLLSHPLILSSEYAVNPTSVFYEVMSLVPSIGRALVAHG